MKNAKPDPAEDEKSRQREADSKAGVGGSTRGPGMTRDSSKKESKGKLKRSVASKSVASRKAAAKNDEVAKKIETLVTEKPVPLTPPKRTSQFVVTVDNVTGVPTKIEKLDSETNERKELSREEYLQMMTLGTSQQSLSHLGFGSNLGAEAGSSAAAQAYYRGVLDYLNALRST